MLLNRGAALSKPIAFLACVLALSACVGKPADSASLFDLAAKSAQPADRPFADSEAALKFHLLAGEMAIQRGQRVAAAQHYVAALEYARDADVAERATRIALFAGRPELAYRAAVAWSEAAPEAIDAHKTAARLALRAGDEAPLRQHAGAVIALNESGPAAGFRELADVLSGETEHAELALRTMQDLAAAHPAVPEAQYALALLAMRYGDYKRAEAAVDAALALRPEWVDAALLRAGLLVRQDKVAEADQWLTQMGGSDAERASRRLAFARMLLDVGMNAAAADAFETALALQPGHSDARYGLGILALTLEQWDRAERAFATLYESGERRADAAFYLATIAESRGDFQAARRWYQRVEGGGHAFQAQVRAARMLYRAGDLDGARAEFEALRHANPDLAGQLYLAEGQMLYQAGEYDAALVLYNQALAEYSANPELLYGRSLVYERLGAIDKAEADLRHILEVAPNDARALNALGYMLSNHSSRYEEALKYIKRALQAQPEDPAVMDSMGWVLYRLGNLDKARGYLQRAYQIFPDPEVAAHFGEVLWRLGQRDQARQVWQEALSEHPDHPVLRETVDRLTP